MYVSENKDKKGSKPGDYIRLWGKGFVLVVLLESDHCITCMMLNLGFRGNS